ncbi:conserved Plasmodium protein, unknown function [Plasmodium relictum]|uniref:Uncharacterized protein n=1 Tax=Plasmodium relictum TaxID=85471 RepID=A0A1J1H6W2_PLARL|nr:conserved Plasmodium protein, unknown function [Plasmodium relictum]CRH00277.1 conserved Plasmodium protein, unknown function [Plasmodium relictum]
MPILKKIYSNYKKDENKNENEKGCLNSSENSYALRRNNARIKNSEKSYYNSVPNSNNVSSNKNMFKLGNNEIEIGNFEMLEHIEKYDSNEKHNYLEHFLDNEPYYIFENLKNNKKTKFTKDKLLVEKNNLINSQNYFHNTYKNYETKNKDIKSSYKNEIYLNDFPKNSLNYLNSSKFIDIFRRKKMISHKLCYLSFLNNNYRKKIDKYRIRNLQKNKIIIDKKKRKNTKIKNKSKKDTENCRNLNYSPFGGNLKINKIVNKKIDDPLSTLRVYRKNYLYSFKFINGNYSGFIRRKKTPIRISKLLKLQKKGKRNSKMFGNIINKNKQSLFERKKKMLNLEDKNFEGENGVTEKREVEEKQKSEEGKSAFIKVIKEKNLNDVKYNYEANEEKQEMNDYKASLKKCRNNINYSLFLEDSSAVDEPGIENKSEQVIDFDHTKSGPTLKENNRKINSQVNLNNGDNFILSFNSKDYKESSYVYPNEKDKESSILNKHDKCINKLNIESKNEDATLDIKRLSENKNMQLSDNLNIDLNIKNLNENHLNDKCIDDKENNQLGMMENSINDYIIDSYLNNNSENFATENYKISDFDNFYVNDSIQTLIKNCDNILKNNRESDLLSNFSESNVRMDSNCELDIIHNLNEHNYLSKINNLKVNDVLKEKNDLVEINNLKENNFLNEKNEFIKKQYLVQNNSSNKEECTIKENDSIKSNSFQNSDNNIQNICNTRTCLLDKESFINKYDTLTSLNKLVSNNSDTFCKENVDLLKVKYESDICLNNEIYKEINLYKYSDNEQNKHYLNMTENYQDLKNQNTVKNLYIKKKKKKEKCKNLFNYNLSFTKLVTSNSLCDIYKKCDIKLKKKKIKNETIIYLRIPKIKKKISILKRKKKKKTELKQLINFQKEKKDTINNNKLKKKSNNLLNKKNIEKKKKKKFIKNITNIIRTNEHYNTDSMYEKLNHISSSKNFLQQKCSTKHNICDKKKEINGNNDKCITNKNNYVHNIKYNSDDYNFQNKKDEHNLKYCKMRISNCYINKDNYINNNNCNNNVNKKNISYEKSSDNNNDKNNIRNSENEINKNYEINETIYNKTFESNISDMHNNYNKDSKNYNKNCNIILKFFNENEHLRDSSFQKKLNKNEKSYNSEYIRMEKMINNIMSLNKKNTKSDEFMIKSNKNNCEVFLNTYNSKKVNNTTKNENIKTAYNSDHNKVLCLNLNIHKNENNKINVIETKKKLVEKVKLKKNKENAFIYLYGYKNLKFGEFCLDLQTLEENCKLFQKLNLSEKKKLAIKRDDITKNYYKNLCINGKNEKICKIISDSFSIENFLTFFTLIKIKNKMNVFLNEISSIIQEINNLIVYIDRKLLEIPNIMSNFEGIKNRKNSSKFIIIKKFMNFFLNITTIYSDICNKVKTQSSVFAFIKFNHEIINNYLLFIKKFSNYISYSALEIQNYYNKIKNVNSNIKGVYLSNEQKVFYRNIYNKLTDHLKNNYEKILIFKKILDIYLIELKNFKKYQKQYIFNKVNILISSKCPYDLLIFSIIIQCKNLCEISIRNICNNFDFNNFQKEKNFYFLFLNRKIKNTFLKKIKKIVSADVYTELKKILFYKQLNRLMNKSLSIKTEEENKLNRNYENNSQGEFYNECLISCFEVNKINLKKKNELREDQKDNKKKKSIKEKKGRIKKNDSFLSNVTTNNLSTCSSMNNYENMKYLENLDQILKTNNTLSLVKNIRKSLNINSHCKSNDSSEEKEKLIEEKKIMNSLPNVEHKNMNTKYDASKNFIMLNSLKKKKSLKNEINSLKNIFKNYELEAETEIKNKNNKKNNTKKIIFEENVNKFYFDSFNDNYQKPCNLSICNLKENISKKNYINHKNLKTKNYSEFLQDSKTNKSNIGVYEEHRNQSCLSDINGKLKLEKNNCQKKKMKIIENIENIKEIEKKYKRLKDIERKEKLKKTLHELKLKKITKKNNMNILKNRALKTKREFCTSLVKKDINGFNTIIKFKINNDGYYESQNRKNQKTFVDKQQERHNDFKSGFYLINKKKLENIFDKDNRSNSYANIDYINVSSRDINEINILNNNDDDKFLYLQLDEFGISNRRNINGSSKNNILNNHFNNLGKKSTKKNECEELYKLNINNKITIEEKENTNLEKDDANTLDKNIIHDMKKNEENEENVHDLNFDKKVFQSKDSDESFISGIKYSNENGNTSLFLKTKNFTSHNIKYKLSDYSMHLKEIKNNKFSDNKENADYLDNQTNNDYIKNMMILKSENYKKLKDSNCLNNITPGKMKLSKKYCELKNIYENQEKNIFQKFFKTEKKIIPYMEEKTKRNKKIENCDNLSKDKLNYELGQQLQLNINSSKIQNAKLINFQSDRNSHIKKKFLPEPFLICSTYKTNESVKRRQNIDKYAKELRTLASEKKIDRSMKNIKNIGSKIKKINIIEELEKKKNDHTINKEIFRDGYVLLSNKNPK